MVLVGSNVTSRRRDDEPPDRRSRRGRWPSSSSSSECADARRRRRRGVIGASANPSVAVFEAAVVSIGAKTEDEASSRERRSAEALRRCCRLRRLQDVAAINKLPMKKGNVFGNVGGLSRGRQGDLLPWTPRRELTDRNKEREERKRGCECDKSNKEWREGLFTCIGGRVCVQESDN